MKDAANCVTHLELQISEKDKDSERILRVGLAQLTWLAVTAICSRPNSEVWMVISCRRLWRRRDRRSQRAFVSSTNCDSRPIVFDSSGELPVRATEHFFAHVHDQLRDYPLNLSI